MALLPNFIEIVTPLTEGPFELPEQYICLDC